MNVTEIGTWCGNENTASDEKNLGVNPGDGACGSIDIRNNVDGFHKLENCSVIEGNLHILLIDSAKQSDYKMLSFPLLMEITGHLLLYRVYGLKTLRHIFPNLTVIRGQDLFYNYALVAYEMPNLEELGLVSLTTIMRGAVRLTKNVRLCYVDTIDWSRIAIGLKKSDHHIQENKDETKCVNYCPERCVSTFVDGQDAKRCWTSEHCQKNLDCNCGASSSACYDDGRRCCSRNCIGGCRDQIKNGRKVQRCVACRLILYQHQCLLRCPPSTYLFMKRRCLNAHQCYNVTYMSRSQSGNWMLFEPDPFDNIIPAQCLDDCPTGYTPNFDGTQCIKCKKSCPKVCSGQVVDSIDSAQQLKGCNKVVGPLEIQIMGGSNIGLELEQSLGDITEVTQYVKIVRSYALLSLHFLKSLKVIDGEGLDDRNKASLVVRDNSNLQELFTANVTGHLRITKGTVNFHGNRKLCMDKINTLVKHLGLSDGITYVDVSPTSNGDLIPCNVVPLNLTIFNLRRNLVILTWPKVQSADERQILSYVINYREVTTNFVNKYQGRDACSDIVWKTLEAAPDEVVNNHITSIVSNLKPWTRYAVYVQTQMLTTANHQSVSDMKIFKTLPDMPTSPTDLQVRADQPKELFVTWKPPRYPNGDVTHYYVYWQIQVLRSEPFNKRDYCRNPIVPSSWKEDTKEQEQNWNVTHFGQYCCSCPKSKSQLEKEERETQIEIEFENYLHDNVYCKRNDVLPEGIDEKYDLQLLTQLTINRHERSVPLQDLQNNTPSTGRQLHAIDDRDLTGKGLIHLNFSESDNKSEDNKTTENTFLWAIVKDTKIVLSHLHHFQEYSIQVLACQDAEADLGRRKLCSNRAITMGRTKPLENADNINQKTVNAVLMTNSSGEVFIKWDPPPYPNGPIIKYNIHYRRANHEDHDFRTVCVSRRKYNQYGGHRLVNIESGNYTYKIAAISLSGNGSFTPLKNFVISTRLRADKSLSGTVISVAVISVILVIIVVCFVVWFVAKTRFSKQDMTVISPNPQYMPSDVLYIPDEWEVPRDKVELLKELGQGSFGMVYEGRAYGLVDGHPEYKVAIKTVNDNAGFQERLNFLKEATTMKTFNCFHVVSLIGVVSKGQPALVIMELMANGDLKNYLRKHRHYEEDNIGPPPTIKQTLQMAGEIADGMAYLSAKKFVHRDLAARNCMVSENKVVKIGDFGMTRDVYETDYYRKGNRGLLPVRWMSPESLTDGVFTMMSDVWSYGIVMWEMATLAAQPYQGLSNEEVVRHVSGGLTLECPDGCPEKLWSIMQRCWQNRAKNRPTFISILEELAPNLSAEFQDVSYYFSDESHADADGNDAHSCAVKAHNAGLDRDVDMDEQGYDVGTMDDELDKECVLDVGLHSNDDYADECRIPFMSFVDPHRRQFYYPEKKFGMPLGLSSVAPHDSPSHGNMEACSLSSCLQRGASGGEVAALAATAVSPDSGSSLVECIQMDELASAKLPSCSSSSGYQLSDGSNESSKSSGSHSHTNGLANGHVCSHSRAQQSR